MIKIKNYKLGEFLDRPAREIEDAMIILRYLHPKKTAKSVWELKFSEVEDLKLAFAQPTEQTPLLAVSMVQGISIDKVLMLPIVEFFGYLNSVNKEMETIADAEAAAFESSEVDRKWKLVNGGEEMAKFGILNTLDLLTNNDCTKYNYVLNMPFSEVFAIMRKRHVERELQIKMSKIK